VRERTFPKLERWEDERRKGEKIQIWMVWWEVGVVVVVAEIY